MRNHISLLAFSLALGSLAHAAGDLAKLTSKREALNNDVMRLVQPLKCSADTDCAALEMGVKPCGGPWKYVIYSKKNSKVATLKKKLADYNALDQKINEQQQTMSDCMVSVKPSPKCVNKMCIDSANANAAGAAQGLTK